MCSCVMSIAHVTVSRSGQFVCKRKAALSPNALARVEEDVVDLDYRDRLSLRGFRTRALERGQYSMKRGKSTLLYLQSFTLFSV